MPYFNSSAIRQAEYDPVTRVLTIWFVESGGPTTTTECLKAFIAGFSAPYPPGATSTPIFATATDQTAESAFMVRTQGPTPSIEPVSPMEILTLLTPSRVDSSSCGKQVGTRRAIRRQSGGLRPRKLDISCNRFRDYTPSPAMALVAGLVRLLPKARISRRATALEGARRPGPVTT